ncbi:DNA polymerase ligase N-terminal domain-containing protein [Tundrisphaera sp. TA3]|uniref:DNA polymerase ligase N-terminal domain-containing protein n=1 Tax=Tundrisphaera sp. TA3 TaxID=3435775 RepID=UPI003EBDB31D
MPGSTRRFAILEHHHQGVHWDFLIEDGDALRTWAIDAPIVAGADLPARELPPHRRIYLNYEGPISGDRGTVRRWDRGECLVLAWDEGRVVVDLRGDQLVGVADLRRAEDPPSRGWLLRLGKVS